MSSDSSDICKSFRDNFRYGRKHADDLADQLTECCSSQLAKNAHIHSIEDMFDETNFARVAVPIMQCQHDRVVALESRTAQIDAVCQTVWPREQCATGEIRGLVSLRVGLDQRGTGQRQLSKACSPRINGGMQ